MFLDVALCLTIALMKEPERTAFYHYFIIFIKLVMVSDFLLSKRVRICRVCKSKFCSAVISHTAAMFRSRSPYQISAVEFRRSFKQKCFIVELCSCVQQCFFFFTLVLRSLVSQQCSAEVVGGEFFCRSLLQFSIVVLRICVMQHISFVLFRKLLRIGDPHQLPAAVLLQSFFAVVYRSIIKQCFSAEVFYSRVWQFLFAVVFRSTFPQQ